MQSKLYRRSSLLASLLVLGSTAGAQDALDLKTLLNDGVFGSE